MRGEERVLFLSMLACRETKCVFAAHSGEAGLNGGRRGTGGELRGWRQALCSTGGKELSQE